MKISANGKYEIPVQGGKTYALTVSATGYANIFFQFIGKGRKVIGRFTTPLFGYETGTYRFRFRAPFGTESVGFGVSAIKGDLNIDLEEEK